MRTKARFMVPVLTRRGVNLPTTATIPASPSDLAIDGSGLSWTDNANNETGYRVEESATGTGGWSTTATLAANSESWAGPTTIGKFYRVAAFNANGSGTSNAVERLFTPDEISDLVSWLDGAEKGSMWSDSFGTAANPGDGDEFQVWGETIADSPGCSFWADAADSDDFVWVEDFNGYSCVRVNGSSSMEALSWNDSNLPTWTPDPVVSQDEQTVFCVAALDVSGGYIGPLATHDQNTGSSAGGYELWIDRRATPNRLAISRNTSGSVTAVDMASQDDSSDIRVMAVRGTGSGGTLQGWKNGTSLGTASLTAGSYHNGTAQCVLGAYQAVGADATNLYIYETLIYDRALTDMEVAQVNDYLTDKYGL